MSSQLRKRPQNIQLTVITKKFLRECPEEFQRLRGLTQKYHDQLSKVRISA